MPWDLERAIALVASDPQLAAFTVRHKGGELRLNNDKGLFVRLIPANQPGHWHMEYFIQRKRWQCREFVGPLNECLELLSSTPHYLFWDEY